MLLNDHAVGSLVYSFMGGVMMSLKSRTERFFVVVLIVLSFLFMLMHGALVLEGWPNVGPRVSMTAQEFRLSLIGSSFGSIVAALYFPLSKRNLLGVSGLKWMLFTLLGLILSFAVWLVTMAWVFEASNRHSDAASMLSGFAGGACAVMGIFLVAALVWKALAWIAVGRPASQKES